MRRTCLLSAKKADVDAQPFSTRSTAEVRHGACRKHVNAQCKFRFYARATASGPAANCNRPDEPLTARQTLSATSRGFVTPVIFVTSSSTLRAKDSYAGGMSPCIRCWSLAVNAVDGPYPHKKVFRSTEQESACVLSRLAGILRHARYANKDALFKRCARWFFPSIDQTCETFRCRSNGSSPAV